MKLSNRIRKPKKLPVEPWTDEDERALQEQQIDKTPHSTATRMGQERFSPGFDLTADRYQVHPETARETVDILRAQGASARHEPGQVVTDADETQVHRANGAVAHRMRQKGLLKSSMSRLLPLVKLETSPAFSGRYLQAMTKAIPDWMREDAAKLKADPEIGRSRTLSGAPIPKIDAAANQAAPAPTPSGPAPTGACKTCASRGEDNHLVDLYHLANTALSDKPASERKRGDRMRWAAAAFEREHPGRSSLGAYKKLDRLIRF